MKLNCLIVDDEPLALEILENYILRTPDLHLTGKCRNALEASEYLSREKIDLMFLDIHMPEITGTDFIKKLENPPPVVFTTAFPDYAVEGFELNALDYLLKPFSYERFMKAVNKAGEYVQFKATEKNHDLDVQDEYIFIKSDKKLLRVGYDEILFVEAFADYVKIYTRDKRIITLQTMKKMEENLPSDRFIRVHRSFIVSLDRIDSVAAHEIQITKHVIPLGKNYREVFLKKIENKKKI